MVIFSSFIVDIELLLNIIVNACPELILLPLLD